MRAVLIIAVILVALGVAGYLLFGLRIPSLGVSLLGRHGGEVAGVEFTKLVIPDYYCTVTINSTHVVRACWAMRSWYMVYFSDGTEMVHRQGMPPELNYTRIEVANLIDRYAYAYEVVDLTPLKLGVFKHLLYNVSFEYRWVDFDYYYPDDGGFGLYPYDPDTGSFVFYVTAFTYTNHTCNGSVCVYSYAPAPMEKIKMYAEVGEAWCSVFEALLGIECTVVPVNPVEVCKWPEEVAYRKLDVNIYEMVEMYSTAWRFSCSEVNGMDVIRVIETPGLIWSTDEDGVTREWSGINIQDKWILVSGIEYFIHELGHSLGLNDVYRVDKSEWPEWMKQIAEGSVMDVPSGKAIIAFSDAAEASILAYYIFSDTSLEEKIYVRLLSLGIDPENGAVLLPLTEDETIPDPFAAIMTQGMVQYSYDTATGKVTVTVNEDLLNLLRTIAEAAKSSH
jgi:hypothetical protein